MVSIRLALSFWDLLHFLFCSHLTRSREEFQSRNVARYLRPIIVASPAGHGPSGSPAPPEASKHWSEILGRAGSKQPPERSRRVGSLAAGWLVRVDWSLGGQDRPCYRRRRKREAAELLLRLVVAPAARSAEVYLAVLEQVAVSLALRAVSPPAVAMAQVLLAPLVAVYLPAPPVVALVGGHDRYRFLGRRHPCCA